MRNMLKIMALSLVITSLIAPALTASDRSIFSIVIEPGLTEFSVEAESFLVVTTQRLQIDFEGAEPTRVWGRIAPLDGMSYELIKFLWTTSGPDPITLHEGVMAGHAWNFDSDNVTGHNEKFD